MCHEKLYQMDATSQTETEERQADENVENEDGIDEDSDNNYEDITDSDDDNNEE